MHGLDVASLGFAINSFGKVVEAGAQHSWELSTPDCLKFIQSDQYRRVSDGASLPLVSGNALELNKQLSPQESGGCFVNMRGGVGVVSMLCTDIRLPHHSRQFSMNQVRFFMVSASHVRAFDFRTGQSLYQGVAIDADDGSWLWLVPTHFWGDFDMLESIHKLIAQVTAQVPALGVLPGGPHGNQWSALAFPSTTGSFWRHVEWMDHACLATDGGAVRVDGVFQRITVNMDQELQDIRLDVGALSRVLMFKRPFTLFKTVPSFDEQLPVRLEWVVRTDQNDWDRVTP